MYISLTIHIPFRTKLVKESSGVLIYLGVRKWLFNFGKLGKSVWIRILGLTFLVGYWKLWPIEFNICIQ